MRKRTHTHTQTHAWGARNMKHERNSHTHTAYEKGRFGPRSHTKRTHTCTHTCTKAYTHAQCMGAPLPMHMQSAQGSRCLLGVSWRVCLWVLVCPRVNRCPPLCSKSAYLGISHNITKYHIESQNISNQDTRGKNTLVPKKPGL